MRLTNLLVFLPLVLAAPIPTFVFNKDPGSLLATSASASAPYPTTSGLISGDNTAIGDEVMTKLQRGRNDITVGYLQASITDLPTIIQQATKTKNSAVENASKTVGSDLATASKALAKIFNDIDNDKKPEWSDQAAAAKSITAAHKGVNGLEKLIVNEDADLCKFIAASVDDLAMIRKGMKAVLAFSNLTFDSVGSQPGEKNTGNKDPDNSSKLYQQGRDEIAEGLGKAQIGLKSVFAQAVKSKNLEVQNGAFAAQDTLMVASVSIFNMLNATGSDTEPTRDDLNKASKAIARVQKITEGLENSIVNKDADLSKLIISLVGNMALIRKGAEEILAVSDLTFETIDEPQGGEAAAGDVVALEKASNSLITDLKSSLKDFGSVAAQAEDSNNEDVSTNARDLRAILQPTLDVALTIADAIKNKSGFSRNDQAILAKGITTAEDLASKLVSAIKNKDDLLSDFITSGLGNLDLARKDVDAILAFDNLTVDNIGEPTEEPPALPSATETDPGPATPTFRITGQ